MGIRSVNGEDHAVDFKFIASIIFKHVLHLHELTLGLTVPCSEVPWPDLSSLRVLNLAITNTPKKLALDTLLPSITHLESSIFVCSKGYNCSKDIPSSEFYEPIGSYIRTATTLKELSLFRILYLNKEGWMLLLVHWLYSNPLSLERLELVGRYSFTGKAADCLGLFIRNSTRLKCLYCVNL